MRWRADGLAVAAWLAVVSLSLRCALVLPVEVFSPNGRLPFEEAI